MGRVRGSGRRWAVVDALNAEWSWLARSSGSTLRSWIQRHETLHGCEDLDDVLRRIRLSADVVLLALLMETRAGCQVAARTVLQAMLGKAVLITRRTAEVQIDDVLGALCCRIASYPVERRPRRIAANLALDALKDAKRWAALRLPEADAVGWPPQEYLDRRLARGAPARSPTASELIAGAVRAEVIAAPAGAVLVSVYVDGMTSRLAAQQHRITPELVRYRCSRAAGQMRRQISSVLAAA